MSKMRNQAQVEYTEPIKLLCGNYAYFDHRSGIGYRCETCMAMVGSIGMPRSCKTLYEQENIIARLKGIVNDAT